MIKFSFGRSLIFVTEILSFVCPFFSQITGFFHSIRDAARQVAEQPESNVTTDKENSSNEPANPNSNGSPTNSTENTEAQAVIFPQIGRAHV